MRVPTYQAQRQLQPASGPRMPFGNEAAQGLTEAGATIFTIAAERQKQHQQETDTADVLNAYTMLRDATRTQMQEVTNLKGVQARGAGKSFAEFYQKKEDELLKDYLFNDRQRQLFKQLSTSHRNERLDSIARHEANEHQVYKQQSQETLYNDTIKELILNPFDQQAAEGKINDFHSASIKLMPGQYTGAEADKAEAVFRTQLMMSMIEQDPLRAEPYLEQWKDEVGIQNYTKFKADIDRKKNEGVINAAYTTLKGLFPDDPDKAVEVLTDAKSLEQYGIDVGQQQALIRVFEGEKARKVEAQRQLKEDARKETLNMVAQALRGNDTKAALDVINRSTALEETEKFELEQKITKPKQEGTDPVLMQKLMKDVTSGKIRYDSEIMQYTGYGITENNEQFLKQLLKDTTADPDQKFYLGLAEDVFDSTFGKGKGASELALYKPEFMAELHKQITGQNPEGKKIKGQQLLDWTKNYIGTMESSGAWYKPWTWGEEEPTGPFKKTVEAEKQRKEGGQPEESQGQPASAAGASTFKIGSGGQAVATKIDDIPEADRNQVIDYLRQNRKAVTKQNILRVYQASKGAN